MLSRRAALAVTTLSVSGLAGCLDGGVPDVTGGGEPEDGDERREILTRYDDAIEARNEGTTTRDSGIELFNVEEFADAIDEIETARDHYDDAERELESAVDVAREIDDGRAITICETALENTRLQIDATEAALEAATTADDGADAGTINDHVERYRELAEEAEEIPITEPEEFSEILGF